MRLARRAVFAILVLASLAAFVRPALAQDRDLLEIWVDPARGLDLDASGDSQINEPAQPCRTLQFAIDKLYAYLKELYVLDPVAYGNYEGVVYCLPGLYGPHGPLSSGDSLPINMRDRVHVQGLNARACILRGTLLADGSNQGYYAAFWPTINALFPYAMRASEVLVAYRESSQYSHYPPLPIPLTTLPSPATLPPWVGTGETAERLDGFTFQGGDIQVLFATHPPRSDPVWGPVPMAHPLAGRISNCVFDMRHGWIATRQDGPGPYVTHSVGGPTFGVLMTPSFNPGFGGHPGYFGQDVMIANNTFIMAEFGNGSWINTCRFEAVAVTDVTDPMRYIASAPTGQPDWVDRLTQYRGLGRPCLINNAFRTRPANYAANQGPMAMLGIDSTDCRVRSDLGAPFRDTNAFVPGRAVGFNQAFISTPVTTVQMPSPGSVTPAQGLSFSEPIYNCHTQTHTPPPPYAACAQAANLPTPIVPLWDGSPNPPNQMYDPMFVGEYLNTVVPGYRDWRLLPGSPLIDHGFYEEPLLVEHGNDKPYKYDGDCGALRTFDRDGEGFGNSRGMRDPFDIGFDEYRLLIVAGSWSNDSICHNDNTVPGAVLQPSAISSGASQRHLIVDPSYAGYTMTVHGTLTSPLAVDPGWVRPPGTLKTPTNDTSAPYLFRLRYIPYNADPSQPPSSNPAMPWVFPFLAATAWPNPVGLPNAPPSSFVDLTQVDQECSGACAHEYFNMQSAIEDYPVAGQRRNSNLQHDYR